MDRFLLAIIIYIFIFHVQTSSESAQLHESTNKRPQLLKQQATIDSAATPTTIHSHSISQPLMYMVQQQQLTNSQSLVCMQSCTCMHIDHTLNTYTIIHS